jgi:hypothetical protein
MVFVNLFIELFLTQKTHLLPIAFPPLGSSVKSQVLVFINVRYFSFAAFFHLLPFYLMKASYHKNGSSMATMHEKSTSLDGALVFLEDFLVASLGVVRTIVLIVTNSGKSTNTTTYCALLRRAKQKI